jgi:hypothetical protein
MNPLYSKLGLAYCGAIEALEFLEFKNFLRVENFLASPIPDFISAQRWASQDPRSKESYLMVEKSLLTSFQSCEAISRPKQYKMDQ